MQSFYTPLPPFEQRILFPPPLQPSKKFCISIVFYFSWDGCNTQEKWKVMQNLGVGGGGAPLRCIMGNVEVAYRAFSPTWPVCEFIGTKESVGIRKEFNSHRTGLGRQHGAISLFWCTNMAVKSCKSTYSVCEWFTWSPFRERSRNGLRIRILPIRLFPTRHLSFF